jgi:ferredoxin
MDMAARYDEQLIFNMTGRRHGEGLDAIDGLGLRPALLAGYRELTRLRYDYPVVLVDNATGHDCVRSLSSLVDGVLRELAPRGIEGERLRRHGLQLEREIRVLLAEGANWTLSELWAMAAARLGTRSGETLEQVLVHAATALKVDGAVLDCTHGMAPQFIRHAWSAAQEDRARAFREQMGRLAVKLTDILRAAFVHSEAGRRPASLKAAVGTSHGDEFDFSVMSKLIGKGASKDDLPPARRKRIEWALNVLRSQRFYAVPGGDDKGPAPHEFAFENCAAAAAAFRARVPEMVELVKAMSVAELEADGRYVEAQDDPFFAAFDEASLGAGEIALFPDYLVCIPPAHNDAPENAALMELLSAGLPLKVLVETTDLVEDATLGAQHFAFGVRSARLANTATALGGVFVVQTASSNLYALRGRIAQAFAHRGAGLFSIYSGAGARSDDLPPYLAAAAAMESRAFPAFTYNPYAGDNQAARFALEDNPQAEADWPVVPFEFGDENLQRVDQTLAFTFVDFALCDKRYAAHFARVPRERWNADMIPAAEWLALDARAATGKVPYILAVDRDNVLSRVLVDGRLMQTALRCRTFWHRLQEQGGIHNSIAEKVLAREKAAWEEQKQREIASLKAEAATAAPAPAPATAAAPAAGAAPAAAPVEEAPAHNPDETWIETERCPSCGECRIINDKMFGYNDNKQAFIADLKAGTYRQLIEATESCQVAIIHPGKPWNPAEPGLDELVKRAEAFR